MRMRVRTEHKRAITHGTPAPAGMLQRACACGQHTHDGGECESCRQKRLAQESTGVSVPQVVHDVLSTPGQPLDAATRAGMEARFGQDFSRVRVHSDAQASESARAVNARAYTVGQHVAFASGQFQPQTDAGQRLLAHELTHVVQQRGVAAGMPLTIGPVADQFEHEAMQLSNAIGDVTGNSQVASPRVGRSTPIIQRQSGEQASEAAARRIRQLARFPREALGKWKLLSQADRDAVLWEIMSTYGPAFAQDFLTYAKGQKKPNPSVSISNSPDLTTKALMARGYRLAGDPGGIPIWVHPSGHEFHVLSPPQGTKPSAPPQSSTQDQPPAQTPPDDRQQRCADPCMEQSDDEDECRACCEQSIPATDDACRRTCEAACSFKL